VLTETAPDDLLAATQLGSCFTPAARSAAMPIVGTRTGGKDEDLANRCVPCCGFPKYSAARACASRIHRRQGDGPAQHQGRYMQDALKYLQIATKATPAILRSC